MRDFIISTESNCDLSAEYIAENDILVIPHYYTVEEEVYGDGRELSNHEFYDKMREHHKVGTMASNPAVIEERFTKVVQSGKDILHISFSSALSGGCGNVIMTSNQVMEDNPGCKIIVVDTLSASMGEAIMIHMAVALRLAGKTIEEVADVLNDLVPHLCVLFTVEDLDYLYRGGRLSKTTAVVGGLIGIKPILRVDENGKLVSYGKSRGRKASLTTMCKMMGELLGEFRDQNPVIGIMHGDCPEDAALLQQMITDAYGYTNFIVEPIGPSIGAHSGPGTMGVAFFGDHR